MGLSLCLKRKRKVDRHLVTVEVGVVAGAHQRMDLDGIAFDQHWLECLDTHPVKGGGPVEKHGVITNDLLENVPDFRVTPFEHTLGALDRVRIAVLLELTDDEGLEEFEGDLLRKAALPELELRPDHDDRPRGIINPLAE